MPNEDEVKKTQEAHPLQETARTLEEKLFDAKDATLRLWERNRHLQQKVGGLEHRMRVLTWLALGLILGSAGLFAVIVKSQIAPLQRQVVALQETVSPLQTKIDEFAGTVMARANTASAMNDDAHSKPVEQEVREAIQKLAPAMLATVEKESGQGRSDNESSGTLVSSAVGTATGPTGETVRLVVGRTDPHKTPWVQYNHGGIYVDID